jgi:HEPN domain-containing protein
VSPAGGHGAEEIAASRRWIAVARADRERGFHLSACLTAQKAAEAALQGWLRMRGLDAAGSALPELLACVPGALPALAGAGARLERYRLDTASAWRSSPDASTAADDTSALACCADAEAVLAHVDRLLAEEP